VEETEEQRAARWQACADAVSQVRPGDVVLVKVTVHAVEKHFVQVILRDDTGTRTIRFAGSDIIGVEPQAEGRNA